MSVHMDYVKKVEELKMKTKEQLINALIHKDRLYNDLLWTNDQITRWYEESKKKITVLETQVKESEKQKNIYEGRLIAKDNDLNNAYSIISYNANHVSEIVYNKFNELKSNLFQDFLNNHLNLEKEKLQKQKDEEIIEIFKQLGVSKERILEIVNEINVIG